MFKNACGLAASSAAGTVAGFLMRPCCAGPLALSLAGVSSVGLAEATVSYRAELIALGAVALIATLAINFRREGGWVNKSIAAAAALIGFLWSMRVLEMW